MPSILHREHDLLGVVSAAEEAKEFCEKTRETAAAKGESIAGYVRKCRKSAI